MFASSIIRQAVRSLVRNKLRSTLTVLGVTIGTAAVICVVAIGEAGSAQVQEQLKNLGENLVWIEAGSRAPNGVRTGARGTRTLIVADAQAILQQVPLINAVSPQIDGGVQIIYGNLNWGTQYRGISPEYLQIRRWNIRSGAMFSETDVERAADVCVIGNTIRDQLFGAEDPVGKIIRVKDMPCQVMGVLQPKGVSVTGQDQDDFILMPYTTVQKKIAGKAWLDDIMCSAVSQEMSETATAQVAALMRERHKIRAGQDDDFNIRSPQDLIQARLASSQMFTMLLVSIASVSLLIGGIGIMNVMLVSVTERTREIGVRVAVGATEAHIKLQFVGEALILSLFGGALGVLFGIAGSFGIGQILDWPMALSPLGIIIAAAFSVVVGIFFGYYPAQKAAALDPIEALRFEY